MISGRDLGWFFNEWVFGERYPKYTYSYSNIPDARKYRSTVNISQTTGMSNPAFFVIPINLKFIAAGWDTTVKINNDVASQTFQIYLSHKPDTVQFDPEGWLLRDATKVASSVDREDASPTDFMLSANYPNPFNPATTIRYALPVRCRVTFTVLNTLGQVVYVVTREEQSAGVQEIQWSAAAASGIYFYRLEAVSTETPGVTFIETKKMALLR